MTTPAERITKTTVFAAPVERVWGALGDAAQFGTWFGAEFDGPFVAGTRLTGRIVPTKVDPTVAKMQEPYAGTPFVVYVVHVEPPRLLSFRWHPAGASGQDGVDPPTTLVEFTLEAVPDGTRLTVTESGFEAIPLEQRARIFESNAQGWSHQLNLIARFLATAA